MAIESEGSSWPEVMDLETAAAYLGFHPVTLREWKRRGEGPPGRKIGGRWRFHKPTLDFYLGGDSLAPLAVDVRQRSGASTRQRGAIAPNDKYLCALGLPPYGEKSGG